MAELQQCPVRREASREGREEGRVRVLRVRDMVRGRGEKQLVPACEIPCEIPLCPPTCLCSGTAAWGTKPVPKARQGQGKQTPGRAGCTSRAKTPSDIPVMTEIGHG